MSVYLVFGYLFAGLLHIFLKEDVIVKHLRKNNITSVVKASLLGIPLPLCSCGVLPAALSLKKDGASRGSVVSFLISTPTTGVDSIFATYAMLGGVFTAYRVFAAFVTALFAGMLTNLFNKNRDDSDIQVNTHTCKTCSDHNCSPREHTLFEKIRSVFRYAFGELLEDTGMWLIGGIIVGGVISYFIPDEFISYHLGEGWRSMLIMLLIGIPMYVCASGSLPIVTALMLKGMSPGAGLVFLMAGPATNSVALTVIAKQLGRATLFIFLISIIICGFLSGMLLDYLWIFFNIDTLKHIAKHSEIIPDWLQILSSTFLIISILAVKISKFKKGKIK